jgi:hypothetical protein
MRITIFFSRVPDRARSHAGEAAEAFHLVIASLPEGGPPVFAGLSVNSALSRSAHCAYCDAMTVFPGLLPDELNASVVGWGNYFRLGPVSKAHRAVDDLRGRASFRANGLGV